MTFGKSEKDKLLIRLERGEEVVETLTSFCKQQGIHNGTVTGIGSIEKPTLAHYRVDSKKYSEKKLDGIFEVTALLGNVAIYEGQPLLHAHITLGDETMHAYAGHLISGIVSATMEIVLTILPGRFAKHHDDEIGLKLFELLEK